MSADRRRRSDAAGNEQRILGVAHEVFAAQGFEAAMESIADQAGVGVGTLYRHFASKEGLVAAVAGDVCTQAATLADQLLAADPGEALFGFMRHWLGVPNAYRALASPPPWSRQAAGLLITRMVPLVDRLVAAAHEAGSLRPGVAGTDVVVGMFGVRAVGQVCDPAAPNTSQRQLEILIDGLRTPKTAPPGTPISAARLAAAVAGRRR